MSRKKLESFFQGWSIDNINSQIPIIEKGIEKTKERLKSQKNALIVLKNMQKGFNNVDNE